jgi:hypothetical protein
MNEVPSVAPGDWINIGDTRCVVATVYDQRSPGEIEVVYLDRNRAINDDVVWREGCWKFKNSGPSGGYADNYPRLAEYVRQLRSRA